MAKEATRMPTEVAEVAKPKLTCGVIMPISDSATHDAAHWESVRTLIHRGISDADLVPHNVWEGSATDRITARILGNLFAHPIAVCDISDLNANVMLELGLRLASRKPTIVVRERGAKIPFDIADFNVLAYPKDMSMLEMEVFLEELTSDLKAKLAAVQSQTYRPFLADVQVEILEPSTRKVSLDQAVLSELQEMSRRLARLELRGRPSQRFHSAARRHQLDAAEAVAQKAEILNSRMIRLPDVHVEDKVLDRLRELYPMLDIHSDGTGIVVHVDADVPKEFIAHIRELIRRFET